MSSQSVVYEKDVRSEERPSQRTRAKIQTAFQIARPAPKFSLRLAPKKLLQIQQATQNHRPVPVLEIWQPLFRKPKLSRDFHQRIKLRTGDIYVTIDESYITTSTGPPKDLCNAERYGDGATSQKNIVAAMCHSGETTSTIYFRDTQCSWQASVGTGPAKSYRFIIKDKNSDISNPGRMILQWEKQRKGNVSATSLDAEQFVLLFIDREARRKSRIATMTPDGFEIIVRKSSILKHLQKAIATFISPAIVTKVGYSQPVLLAGNPEDTIAAGSSGLEDAFSGSALLSARRSYFDVLHRSWIMRIALFGLTFLCALIPKLGKFPRPGEDGGKDDRGKFVRMP
ncbi:hypothetical protein N7537_002481 [Penicillium hordei]|uniref:Uncharacterized protein n=1 Tax=Penicillium hordei TaxID=40994 RepID=A0AAD6EJ81_9EURO|nr:uncharacterized protein N7537_002481 [Penicillium hordei]KAJ5617367.1 hypothetical protein N7537_002481 [Penicillium hordei]